jgi:hypothetical protein
MFGVAPIPQQHLLTHIGAALSAATIYAHAISVSAPIANAASLS